VYLATEDASGLGQYLSVRRRGRIDVDKRDDGV